MTRHKKPDKQDIEETKTSPANSEDTLDTERIHAKLEQAIKEKDELFEKFQRLGADYANFQKRSAKQLIERMAYEKQSVVERIFPAMDNFEHTLEKAQSAENVTDVLKGVQIVYDQLLDIFSSLGVKQINCIGEKFDPSRHQAMMQRCEPDKADGIVLEEFQTGYSLNGRVIRPSKVIVNKIETEENGTPAQEDEKQTDESMEQ